MTDRVTVKILLYTFHELQFVIAMQAEGKLKYRAPSSSGQDRAIRGRERRFESYRRQ